MLRASAFATGLFIALWGAAFLVIDKIVLFNPPADQQDGIRGMLIKQDINQESRPVIDPADWTAFTLMSMGSVTMLYAVALPRRSA